MEQIFINIALAIAALLIGLKLLSVGIKGLATTISLCMVIVAVAPGAYAAGKAEAALPKRNTLGDPRSNPRDARLFNAIVQDRLRHARVGASHPQTLPYAINLGRKIAGAAWSRSSDIPQKKEEPWKKFHLSYYQQAALQELAEKGEIVTQGNITLDSLVRRGLVTKEEIEGSEESRFQLATIKTVGELAKHLLTLDQDAKIGIRGKRRELVRPITMLTEDTLHIARDNRAVAMRGEYARESQFYRFNLQESGNIVIIE